MLTLLRSFHHKWKLHLLFSYISLVHCDCEANALSRSEYVLLLNAHFPLMVPWLVNTPITPSEPLPHIPDSPVELDKLPL